MERNAAYRKLKRRRGRSKVFIDELIRTGIVSVAVYKVRRSAETVEIHITRKSLEINRLFALFADKDTIIVFVEAETERVRTVAVGLREIIRSCRFHFVFALNSNGSSVLLIGVFSLEKSVRYEGFVIVGNFAVLPIVSYESSVLEAFVEISESAVA